MGISTPYIMPLNINGFLGQLKTDIPSVELVFIVKGYDYPHKKEEIITEGHFKLFPDLMKNLYKEESKKSGKSICVVLFDFFIAKVNVSLFAGGKERKADAVSYSMTDPNDYWYLIDNAADTGEWLLQSKQEADSSLLCFPLTAEIEKDGKLFINDKMNRYLKMKDYTKYVLANKNFTALSALTVYLCIALLGNILPGRLRELHFFSHAFEKGPILINTMAIKSASLEKQKFIDRDPRVSDFSEKQFLAFSKLFKKAFSEKSFSMVWGCLVDENTREIINLITADVVYLKNNSKQVKYNNNLISITDYRNREDFVEVDGKSKTIKEWIQIIEITLKGNFGTALAKSSGRDVIAAFDGTSALFDNEPSLQPAFPFGHKLMHVALGDKYDAKKKKKVPEDFTRVLQFYTVILNKPIASDSEHAKTAVYLKEYSPVYGRGYGVFDGKI